MTNFATYPKPPAMSILNRAHPLAKGLVACYLFTPHGVSGDRLYDISGFGRHGTLNSITTSDWVTGRAGDALHFDGSNDYVDIGNWNVTGSGISVDAIFKMDASATTDDRLVSKADGAPANSHVWMAGFDISVANKMRMRVRTGGTTTTLVGTVSIGITYRHWYHGLWTYDESFGEMRLYLGGEPSGTAAHTGAVDTDTDNINIGRNPNNSSYLDGKVALLRIWDRGIDHGDAQWLARDPYDMFRSPHSPGVHFHVAAAPAARRLFVVS